MKEGFGFPSCVWEILERENVDSLSLTKLLERLRDDFVKTLYFWDKRNFWSTFVVAEFQISCMLDAYSYL